MKHMNPTNGAQMGEREAGPWRWLVLLSAPLVLGLLALSAIATNTESRDEFIRRWKFGPLPEVPDFDPNLPPPNFPNAPNLPDGPDINLPPVDPPSFLGITLQGLFYLLFVLAVIALLATVVLYLTGRGLPGRIRRGTALSEEIHLRSHGPDYSGAGWMAFEAFLAELLADPDPTRAVRVGFRYAENGFGSLPARLVDETPNEWERRITPLTNAAPALTPLINRYNAVRFGGANVTAPDRDQSVMELRTLARTACTVAPSVPGMAQS